MPYLLDTDIVSDLMRHPHGKVAQRIAQTNTEDVVTSIVVAAELRFGVVRKGTSRLIERLEAVLSEIEILPLSEPADRAYAEIRADLEQRGALIGPNDLLIAAHALALGCTLVTNNEREFARVKSLKVENWLR